MDSAFLVFFSFFYFFSFFLSFFFFRGKHLIKLIEAPPRPSLNTFLIIKHFQVSFVRENCCRRNGTCEQTISSQLIFLIRRHENQLPYFSRFFSFKVINFWRIRQNHFWNEIFISTERKNIHSFWQVGYFKWRRFLSSTLYFFTVIWTQTADFVTALNPPSSLLGISCRFQFHNLWRAWNLQRWLFIILHFSIFTVTMEPQFREGV